MFIIDDDEAIRSGLSMLVRSFGYQSESFSSAETFLTRCGEPMPDRFMAVLDLSMPEMNGLELQEALLHRQVDVPIVFLSGDGDIPAAVTAVRHGAVDFIEKPVEGALLLDRIDKALAQQASGRRRGAGTQAVRKRLLSLTPREREVLENIAQGKTSKAIAYELGISDRTVELHRSRVLRKMGVRNSSELLNRVIPSLYAEKDTGE